MNIDTLRNFFIEEQKKYPSETALARVIDIPQQTFNEFMKGVTKFPRGNNLLKMLDYYNQKNVK